MKHNLVSKQSVLDYNKKYDDEIIYEDVVKQVEQDLDFAIESLVEKFERVKEGFYISEYKYPPSSDYLNVDTEIVNNGDFVRTILDAVRVVVKEQD